MLRSKRIILIVPITYSYLIPVKLMQKNTLLFSPQLFTPILNNNKFILEFEGL